MFRIFNNTNVSSMILSCRIKLFKHILYYSYLCLYRLKATECMELEANIYKRERSFCVMKLTLLIQTFFPRNADLCYPKVCIVKTII